MDRGRRGLADPRAQLVVRDDVEAELAAQLGREERGDITRRELDPERARCLPERARPGDAGP